MEKSRLKDLALEKEAAVPIPKSKSQIAKAKRAKVQIIKLAPYLAV
jgi:hypothetical protein